MSKSLVKLLIVLVGLADVGVLAAVELRPDALEHVYFLNVGQGDAALIKTPTNQYILIDGGPDQSVLEQLGRVLPIWHRRLDLVVLTHPHADHATGLLSVVDQYQVSQFWYTGTAYESTTYRTLLEKILAKHIPIQLANQGDFYQTGDTKLQVLFPISERPTDADPNQTSVVGLLTYKNFSVLFTGDATAKNEINYSAQVPDIDMIKVPHHGSDSASTPSLVDHAKPEVGVVSVGADNSYGHPNAEAISRFQSSGSHIYRTDQNGAVYVTTDGQRYRIVTQH